VIHFLHDPGDELRSIVGPDVTGNTPQDEEVRQNVDPAIMLHEGTKMASVGRSSPASWTSNDEYLETNRKRLHQILPLCRAGIARYSMSRGMKRAMRLEPLRGLTPYEEIYTRLASAAKTI
jgi:hypothetical protein